MDEKEDRSVTISSGLLSGGKREREKTCGREMHFLSDLLCGKSHIWVFILQPRHMGIRKDRRLQKCLYAAVLFFQVLFLPRILYYLCFPYDINAV